MGGVGQFSIKLEVSKFYEVEFWILLLLNLEILGGLCLQG